MTNDCVCVYHIVLDNEILFDTYPTARELYTLQKIVPSDPPHISPIRKLLERESVALGDHITVALCLYANFSKYTVCKIGVGIAAIAYGMSKKGGHLVCDDVCIELIEACSDYLSLSIDDSLSGRPDLTVAFWQSSSSICTDSVRIIILSLPDDFCTAYKKCLYHTKTHPYKIVQCNPGLWQKYSMLVLERIDV